MYNFKQELLPTFLFVVLILTTFAIVVGIDPHTCSLHTR